MENAEPGLRVRPLYGRVLIKREVKKKTAGGIIIPDTHAKRHSSCKGEIIALGETAGWTETHYESENGLATKIVQPLKVGDQVMFGRHAGTWIDATYNDKTGEANDDGELFMCQDQDILAVIERAA